MPISSFSNLEPSIPKARSRSISDVLDNFEDFDSGANVSIFNDVSQTRRNSLLEDCETPNSEQGGVMLEVLKPNNPKSGSI